MSTRPLNPILFDVDGTLVQSGELVMECFASTLEDLGANSMSMPQLRKVVGPPLAVSFAELAGIPQTEVPHAVEVYRSRYLPRMLEPPLYAGIAELLADLAEIGIPLATATSKMERAAKRQLEHWNIDRYFTEIAGATPDPTCTKESVIADALSRLQQKGYPTDDAVLIGDRIFDAEGAHANNIRAIGALWGYGDESEFTAPAVIAIAETVSQLREMLL